MATPTTLPTLADAVPGNLLPDMHGTGVSHAEGTNEMIDDIYNAWAKLGIGATTPARGNGLIGGSSGSVWDRVERKNRLIGGSAQLWDQGTSPTATDNAYIGGNWRVLLEAANACTVTRETSDLPTSGARWAWKVIAGSGNNNKFGIFQVIEGADIWDLRSTVASLQAAIKIGGTLADMRFAICQWTSTEDATTGDPISSWGSAGTNPTLATNWAYANTPANLSATTSWASYFAENVSISASATNLAVFIWSDDRTTTQTTDFFLLTDVQLERGAVCTSVERRKKSEEQALDARFYNKTFAETVAPAQNTGTTVGALYSVVTVAGASGANGMTWGFPARMRATPTITTYSPSAASANPYNVSVAATSGTTFPTNVGDRGAAFFNQQLAGDSNSSQIILHATASARI